MFKYVQSGKKVSGRFALYELKWVLFKWFFDYVKVLPYTCLPDMFWQLIRPFKWGTAWSSISRSIRINTNQIQKFQENALLLSKFQIFRRTGWAGCSYMIFLIHAFGNPEVVWLCTKQLGFSTLNPRQPLVSLFIQSHLSL